MNDAHEESGLDALDAVVPRFRDAYFIRVLDDDTLFVIPNFVVQIAGGHLTVTLLDHVSAADQAEIEHRLHGLPYALAPERPTLREVENRWGFRFPDEEE